MSDKTKQILQDFWDKNPKKPKNLLFYASEKEIELSHISMGTGIPKAILRELYEKGPTYKPETEKEWEHYGKIYSYLVTDGTANLPEHIKGPPY